ncbi:cytochrome c peroxidase [Flavivirga abyssicola]|uniref:cytochrome-c peroxidase n=1 Tax=Flavivirga abyssicola TaxID=3063533 RepID=UPI0026E08F54|nr:cytochrome c peroxidase [Flavivirga sp. MEBiC07777]WVK13353.1 cytochrome c peroxidase [Flavivirga sp. MEBiC07777]
MNIHLNFIFKAKAYTLSVCLLLLSISCINKEKNNTEETITKTDKLEKLYSNHLVMAYKYLDSIDITNNNGTNKKYYLNSRMHFKKSEPILSYIEKENYKSLNSPNLLRIQEEDPTDIKINQPIGYQVVEENLLSESMDTLALSRALKVTSGRLKLIENNIDLSFKDYHVLWLVRDAIVRIASTGLSNFDSPILGASLNESGYALGTLNDVFTIYQNNFKNKDLLQKWKTELINSQKTLNTDFDSLDRYEYIKNHTNKQLELLKAIQEDWSIEFPLELALKNNTTSLFSKNTFNLEYFSDYKSDTAHLNTKIDLGKQLFNDKRFSIKNDMSCATCHIKEKAFTDEKITFNKHVKRNTPTLTYSGLQKSFFLDNRSGSLEGQIVGVVTNHDEFNADLKHIIEVVKHDKNYAKAFDTLYARGATDMNIRHSIASYVRSLNEFSSKFDNNINGKENTLTEVEKRGFNIFMGKASCATCHFPPLFNGTVPPNFSESELEIIGVPETKENKKLDDDLGRYNLFKTEERKGAFKTPTIRNIELTTPYMHNGVYETLEQVMDFYNKGGGSGLGFNVPHQTLPFDNLDLSEDEIQAIIAFMRTLTDNHLGENEAL